MITMRIAATDELFSGQNATFLATDAIYDDVNGLHDVSGDLPDPVYDTGPLGRFYLPTGTTDLDSAGHGTPADIGLYHYTTRANQSKETGNVDIGFHYVATAGQSSTAPVDSDGDGIPDYVEDANGNGQWDSETETKTDDMYTDTGIEDSLNERYDDVDLDGDGMVGRIEKLLNPLNPQPLTEDNPLILEYMQDSTRSRPEFREFKLPISFAFLTDLADARLWLEDGTEPEVQGVLEDDGDGSTLLIWNTTFDPPGDHFLQPRIYLKTLPSETEDAAITEAVGPLLPFTTDNALQFEDLYSTFDDAGLILFAKTYPGTQYSIELQDADGSHLNTILGTVPLDSDQIDVTWDLRCDDPGQTLYTGDTIMAQLYRDAAFFPRTDAWFLCLALFTRVWGWVLYVGLSLEDYGWAG